MLRFNNAALFVSSGDSFSDQTIENSVIQLSRIQSVGLQLDFSQDSIQSLDQKNEITSIERPDVILNIDYFPTNGFNERRIGFFTNLTGNAIKKLNEYKNYYISYLDNNFDYNFNYNPNNITTLSVGNCLLESWSISASVGGLLRAQATIRGLNLASKTGGYFPSPAVNFDNGDLFGNNVSIPSGSAYYTFISPNPADGVPALTAGEIELFFPNDSVFSTVISGDSSCLLQDFSFSLNLNRGDNKKLGNIFSERPIQFPCSISLSASAILRKYQAEQLLDLNCAEENHNVSIIMKTKCTNVTALELKINKIRLVNQSFETNINGNGFVQANFQWEGQINSFGTGNTFFGLFASQGNIYYSLESYQDLTGFFSQEQIWQQQIFENQF